MFPSARHAALNNLRNPQTFNKNTQCYLHKVFLQTDDQLCKQEYLKE